MPVLLAALWTLVPALSSPAALAQAPDPSRVVPIVQAPPPQAVALSAQVRVELDAAQALVAQVEDEALRARIEARLDRARGHLLSLEGLPGGVGVIVPHRDGVVVVGGGALHGAPRAQGPRHGSRAGPALTPLEMEDLTAALEAEGISSQQLRELRSRTRGRSVTVAQVTELMGLFTFGRDQVEVAATLHDQVRDPEHWSRVYTIFKFSTDADRLRERIGDTGL